MYRAESAFVLKYSAGRCFFLCSPYKDLGIDTDAEIKAADIAQYTVDIGTRPSDNAVVGLGYQATGGAHLPPLDCKGRFGTDDPATISTEV